MSTFAALKPGALGSIGAVALDVGEQISLSEGRYSPRAVTSARNLRSRR